MLKPAVFLDRDGTLIAHVHHLTSPDDVRLLPGAGAALRSLQAAGWALVLVTNQSVLGRGLLSEEGLEEVHRELGRQLDEHGVRLDGYYSCPIVPESEDRTRIEHPDRKPGPRMLLRAADELGLDMSRSWMVGDMLSDVLAGRNAGCRSILVASSHGVAETDEHPAMDFLAADLGEAATIILSAGLPDSV